MKKNLFLFILFICSNVFSQFVTFTDVNFKNKLLSSSPSNQVAKNLEGNWFAVDQNGDGNISFSEASYVSYMKVDNSNISSINGINRFYNIETLICSNNNIQYLNLEENGYYNLVDLIYLDCSFNQLNQINFGGANNIEHLDCSNNLLTQLSFPYWMAPQSEFVNVRNNLITELIIDGNYINEILYEDNPITSLRFDNWFENELTIPSMPLLDTLQIYIGENFSPINILPQSNLSILKIFGNQEGSDNEWDLILNNNYPSLSEIVVDAKNVNLTIENLALAQINPSQLSLGVKSCVLKNLPNLTQLDISGEAIQKLNIENLPNLEIFRLIRPLNELVLISLPELKILDFDLYYYSGVELPLNFVLTPSEVPELEELIIVNDNLNTDLYIQNHLNLKKLNVGNPALFMNNLPSLEEIVLRINKLNFNEGIISFGDFPNLSSANIIIDHNEIEIQDLIFYNLPQLSNLELSLSSIYNYEDINMNSLDFSTCPALTDLQLIFPEYLHIDFINFKNGNSDFNELYLGSENINHFCVDSEEERERILQEINIGYHDPEFTFDCPFNSGGYFNKIYGAVTFDINNNNCSNSNVPANNLMLSLESNSSDLITYSNENGYFNFYTQVLNENLVITPSLNDNFIVNPISQNISFTNYGNESEMNFCVKPNSSFTDLEIIVTPISEARPGFNSEYKIIYRNLGNTIVSGEVKLHYPEEFMNLISSSPNYNSNQNGTLSWNFTDLSPLQSKEIYLNFQLNTPTDVPPLNGGDILNFTSQINTSNLVDNELENNIYTHNQTVVNSFDPNDKTCLEGERVLVEQINEFVHYLIRFENTGTASAINIIVKDEIDINKFDISSLTPISSSHDYYTKIDGNKVEFIFENIQLPFDDENNDGYVLFKIKTKSNLVIGDTFNNQASIYFDYNAPIITNNYETTVVETMNLDEIQSKLELQIYPNPTNDLVWINSKMEISKVEVFSTEGKFLKIVLVGNKFFSTKELLKGVYLLKLYFSDNTAVTKKLIKK